MIHYCDECGDGFGPLEFISLGDESFCSDECSDRWNARNQNTVDYDLSRRGGAPAI